MPTPEKLITPLLKVRISRGLLLKDVVGMTGMSKGNLSKIENNLQYPSRENAELLASVFSDSGLTEMHLLYPERYGKFRARRPRQYSTQQ